MDEEKKPEGITITPIHDDLKKFLEIYVTSTNLYVQQEVNQLNKDVENLLSVIRASNME
jgi:hypothetical protein